jgi:hypothetical protein
MDFALADHIRQTTIRQTIKDKALKPRQARCGSIVFGCFAESVPKSFFRDLGTKREPKRAKRKPKGSKREPKGAKRETKGAKREPKWSQWATKMH